MTKSRVPDSLVLIFAMILLAKVATLVLPRGTFDREESGSVIPGTYAPVVEAVAEGGEASEGSSWIADVALLIPEALMAIPRGMESGADIIFLVFLVGGVIGVVRRTGAIDALIGAAIKGLAGRPAWLVAGMVTLFALGSSSIGMAEEYMPFIPILVTMCIALKMDAIVAMGIVYIGAGVGYGCAALNPFTVVIAQKVAGLPPTSGQLFRWAILPICLAVGIHHVLRYARRIQREPEASLVRDVDYSAGFEIPEDTSFTARRITILAVFAAGVALFVWGATYAGWYLTELDAVFLGIGLLAAWLGKLGPNTAAREFCAGAAEMTTTALLIGFAYTIKIVLEDGQVIDTVIHAIAQPLERVGTQGAAVGMLGVQALCNFFIPSGSGQAYVTMPIMAPLADLTGITRQTAVLAYQFGDGFTNMIVPTNGLLMGMLALGKIPYQRWVRFVAPLLVKLFAVAAAALLVAVAIGYS